MSVWALTSTANRADITSIPDAGASAFALAGASRQAARRATPTLAMLPVPRRSAVIAPAAAKPAEAPPDRRPAIRLGRRERDATDRRRPSDCSTIFGRPSPSSMVVPYRNSIKAPGPPPITLPDALSRDGTILELENASSTAHDDRREDTNAFPPVARPPPVVGACAQPAAAFGHRLPSASTDLN